MRRSACLLCLSVALLALPATPASAELLLFDGTLEYVFPATAAFVPGGVVLAVPVSGTAIVNGTVGVGHLSTLSLTFLGNAVNPGVGFGAVPGFVSGLTVSVPPTALSGTFMGISGGGFGISVMRTIGGTFTVGGVGGLPLPGTLRLCALGGCGPPIGATLPLSAVGSGFPTTSMGVFSHRLRGAFWTVATAFVFDTPARLLTSMGGTVFTQTLTGFAHGPASLTSSTALTSGVVQLVAPSVLSNSVGAPSLAGFGRLTIHFVPEPGRGLLLGSGLLALVAASRLRRR